MRNITTTRKALEKEHGMGFLRLLDISNELEFVFGVEADDELINVIRKMWLLSGYNSTFDFISDIYNYLQCHGVEEEDYISYIQEQSTKITKDLRGVDCDDEF